MSQGRVAVCRQQDLPLHGGTARSACKRIHSVRYAAANAYAADANAYVADANAYAADANAYAASATRRHGTQRQRTLLQPNPPHPPLPHYLLQAFASTKAL